MIPGRYTTSVDLPIISSISVDSKIGIATLLAKNQKVMNVTLEKSFVKPMKELAEKLK